MADRRCPFRQSYEPIIIQWQIGSASQSGLWWGVIFLRSWSSPSVWIQLFIHSYPPYFGVRSIWRAVPVSYQNSTVYLVPRNAPGATKPYWSPDGTIGVPIFGPFSRGNSSNLNPWYFHRPIVIRRDTATWDINVQHWNDIPTLNILIFYPCGYVRCRSTSTPSNPPQDIYKGL